MPNVQGRELTAREVEHGFRLDQGADERFASLCNSVAWAESRGRTTSLPSFTERVKVKDYGIDAEWETELIDDGNDHPLLGSGWNVYQYKMRDLTTDDRADLISRLVSELKGGKDKKAALADLHERTGRRPDRYVLFTNLDLTHPTVNKGKIGQKQRLKEAILEGYDRPEDVRVEIVGAAELAVFLNGLPPLRFAYFGGSSFATAQEELRHHKEAEGFRAGVALLGREAELGRIASFLKDTEARAMIVSGPHGMGKTRLVLEATAHECPVDTVFALGGTVPEVSALRALRSEAREAVLIVEDPGAGGADTLVREALGAEGLKVIVTAPTAEGEPVPGYRRGGGRVRHMRLEPLDHDSSQELLRAAGAELGFGVGSWVIERAGGNPGVLLAAAEAGPELEREGTASFSEEVGRIFEARVRRELGEGMLGVLETLSMLARTGVGGEVRTELETVTEVLGGPTVNEVRKALPRLEQAGLVRRRREYAEEEYAEVTPAFFANHLAASTLLGRDQVPATLLGVLGVTARERMLDRLKNLGVDEVARFWDALYESGGLLHDLPSALASPHLLVPAAAAIPERTAWMIEEDLSQLGVEERLAIEGVARRQLVFSLQELLARRKTAETAMRCLLLLAEAENESYGNNATSVFSETFRPIHPLIALPLEDRLQFLEKTLLDADANYRARRIVVKAVAESLSMRGMVLYQGGGAEPLEGRPATTYGEVWAYLGDLVDLLMEATCSGEHPLAEAAGKALLRAIADLAWQAPPENAVKRMEEVVVWAVGHEAPVPVSELLSQVGRVESSLERLINAHEVKIEDERASERAQELRAFSARMKELRERIERGDFRTRLETWAGSSWLGGSTEMVPDGSGGMIFRYVVELRKLAKEAAEDPEKLPDELLSWAIYSSEIQKRPPLFRALGEFDSGRTWLERLESAGEEEGGAIAFAAYFGGLGEQNARFAGERLDELAAAGRVTLDALLRATAELGDGGDGVARVEELISDREVMSSTIAVVLAYKWVEDLSDAQLSRLLDVLAGPNCENASAVVSGAGYWNDDFAKDLGKEPADVLWWCLGRADTSLDNVGYAVDRLAALLSRRYPEQGFVLMEWLLRRPFSFGMWEPIGYYNENLLWKALCEEDRERAYRLVISLAQEDSALAPYIAGGFKGVLAQERDADILLAIAKESRTKAELVAKMLSGAVPGFWPLAVRVAEVYPPDDAENDRLRAELENAVFEPEHMVHPEGRELVKSLEVSLKEMEKLPGDDATPEAVRRWLGGLAEHLRRSIERELISEAKEEAERFRSGGLAFVENAENAADRLFAVRKLLELGWLPQTLRVFSRDELLRLLPGLHFSAEEENSFRQDIERV